MVNRPLERQSKWRWHNKRSLCRQRLTVSQTTVWQIQISISTMVGCSKCMQTCCKRLQGYRLTVQNMCACSNLVRIQLWQHDFLSGVDASDVYVYASSAMTELVSTEKKPQKCVCVWLETCSTKLVYLLLGGGRSQVPSFADKVEKMKAKKCVWGSCVTVALSARVHKGINALMRVVINMAGIT